MNRQTVKTLRTQIQNALQELAASEGVSITVGNASFTETSVSFKMNIVDNNVDGTTSSQEEDDFKTYGARYGMNADDLGKKFRVNNNEYTLIGLKPRSRKYPFLGKRSSDGKVFKFDSNSVSTRY